MPGRCRAVIPQKGTDRRAGRRPPGDPLPHVARQVQQQVPLVSTFRKVSTGLDQAHKRIAPRGGRG